MATYKVIQDIEADDKLIGPLTPRQALYAAGGLIGFYLTYLIGRVVPLMAVIPLLPALFCLFFAIPFGKDQPTEVWALAKIKFLFMPRKRLWNQSGAKHLVTITVPKKIERTLTNGLSQTEVKSRLKALANTIDSRGWAVKNINVNLYGQMSPLAAASSDRLIDLQNLPQEVPNYDVTPSDDIMDERNNPVAYQVETMIQASEQAHRQKLIQQMHSASAPAAPAQAALQAPQAAQSQQPAADYWFLSQAPQTTQAPVLPPGQSMFGGAPVVQPAASAGQAQPDQTASLDEKELAARLKAQKQAAHQASNFSHLRTLPVAGSQPAPAAPPVATVPVTPQPDPDILSLANNNDLNVATLARQAQRARQPELPPDDEVIISLH